MTDPADAPPAASRRIDIPVPGGALAAEQWGDGETLVVASHGITANRRSWDAVATALAADGADVTLVAVDHRGRAGSADTPGPYGLEQHANDVIRVADHLGGQRVVLTGHSMGAFVVALAAERHPDRVERLVLVDGGIPIPGDIPPDADVEAVVRAVIGPALDRLDQRWDDVESYVDFFRAHPAFAPPNDFPPAAEAYVREDATEDDDGRIGSSVRKEAVLVDGGAAIVDPSMSRAVERITTPAHLLWAPRGLLDQTPGLFPPHLVDEFDRALAHLTTELVDDTNHYTILAAPNGAAAVAAAIGHDA